MNRCITYKASFLNYSQSDIQLYFIKKVYCLGCNQTGKFGLYGRNGYQYHIYSDQMYNCVLLCIATNESVSKSGFHIALLYLTISIMIQLKNDSILFDAESKFPVTVMLVTL